jgi:hypothetical protein
MALFQLSYKDYIRKLTIESREKELKNRDLILDDIQLYPYYINDMSSAIEPIDNVLMHKRINNVHCIYNIQLADTAQPDSKKTDDYLELTGENSILTPIFRTVITTDFLTGYYFAKLLIGQSIKSIDKAISFHFGCTDLQFITGIEKQIGKSAGRWKWFGADIKMGSPAKYLNGINKTGDLNNIDVVKSIRNQLSEVLKHKLTFYVSDVNPNLHQLYNSLIIPLMDVDKSGFSILRLPDLPNWARIHTHMINFLLLCSSHFEYVKIFNTPWGVKTKYYLIIAKPKTQFTLIKYNTLVKYLEELNELRKTSSEYPMLYIKSVFTDSSTEEFVANYAIMFDKLSTFTNSISPTEANRIWFDLVMVYK